MPIIIEIDKFFPCFHLHPSAHHVIVIARNIYHPTINQHRFDEDLKTISPWATSAWSQTDLQRLKRGRLSAQVSPETSHNDSTLPLSLFT